MIELAGEQILERAGAQPQPLLARHRLLEKRAPLAPTRAVASLGGNEAFDMSAQCRAEHRLAAHEIGLLLKDTKLIEASLFYGMLPPELTDRD